MSLLPPDQPMTESVDVIAEGSRLSELECFALLATAERGRIGVTVSALPAIFPIHYRIVDHRVVFRAGKCGPPSSALSGTVVAFQVDHRDGSGSGTVEAWNVQAVGVARVSSSPEDHQVAASLPDAAGAEVVAFHPARLSGWRLGS